MTTTAKYGSNNKEMLVTIDIRFPASCEECEIGKLHKRNLSDGICPLTGFGKPKGRRSLACPLRQIEVNKL